MELWIRSQDKENLSKAEHLGVYNEKIYVNGYEENGYCIGIYKTKERALEVLDEIQNILKPTIKIKYEYDDRQPIMNGEWLKFLKEESKIEELSTYVYQMPEN